MSLLCVIFAQLLIFKLLRVFWKELHNATYCGLQCHFRQTLKLNIQFWLGSRTRLCFGQNIPNGKQEPLKWSHLNDSWKKRNNAQWISENVCRLTIGKKVIVNQTCSNLILFYFLFLSVYLFCINSGPCIVRLPLFCCRMTRSCVWVQSVIRKQLLLKLQLRAEGRQPHTHWSYNKGSDYEGTIKFMKLLLYYNYI